MGHHTTFRQDIEKGIYQTKLLVKAFNKLSNQKHKGRMQVFLKQFERHDGSTVIMCDKHTNKFLIVDPRPRLNMEHHKSGHMIHCRNSKMGRQERIDWAIDRIIWLVVMQHGIPISYSIVPVKTLHKSKLINFNSPPSNPTALMFSVKDCMPTIPWQGGTDGFRLIHYEDVVEAFIRIVNG